MLRSLLLARAGGRIHATLRKTRYAPLSGVLKSLDDLKGRFESLNATTSNRLATRFESGPVICAEGYLFELERRGYLQAGSFVPEVVLEHPEKVRGLHEEFARAGSDVILALT